MKELDFDELDRAVNSLMGGVSKTKPVKPDEDGAKTLTINPSLQDGAVPNFESLVATDSASQSSSVKTTETPSMPSSPASQSVAMTSTETTKPTPTPSEAPAKAPSLAARRGGRFMDVVHPSSDMKSATPSQPISRQGVTIERAPSRQQPATSGATTEQQDAKSTPVASEPVSVSSAPANDWPDPLEMADFKQQDDDDQPQAPADSAAESLTPLTSPFLSGTKVEKRPLGGAPSDDVSTPVEKQEDVLSSSDTHDTSAATTGDPAAQLPAEPTDIEAPLPEELRSDLMAIESGAHPQDAAASEPTQAEKQPDAAPEALSVDESKPATPTSSPIDEAKEVTTALPVASTADQATSAPAGPTSIAQQYKEEPSTGDQTSGAIYDTDTYHQPLAHPAKKKSGWMWVIWIVLILLLGAGGGVAVYFMGIV